MSLRSHCVAGTIVKLHRSGDEGSWWKTAGCHVDLMPAGLRHAVDQKLPARLLF